MEPIALPAAPRILVIALRRLGDVLLTTPLIRSVKRAWPDATIDVLAFEGTGGILAGNPDVAQVITMPARRSATQSLALAGRLWKRYALAISTQAGDRPTLFALLAGKTHAGLVDARLNGRLKKQALGRSVGYEPKVHRVEEMLRFADALGIARCPEVVAPGAASAGRPDSEAPYAVIHAAPMFRYKRWPQQNWRALAASLAQRGLSVVATGGPDPAERAYLDAVWQDHGAVKRLDGKLDWRALAETIARARIFIGPDTSVTHLAAATGCPTVALYGPTDPRLWGPWPRGGLSEDWRTAAASQRRGNVWIVQNPLPCMPCQKEGCERHVGSPSVCLDEMSPGAIWTAVDEALATSQTR